ncbi:MAG: SAM-dependent chlorinase/fluorinase [Chloroflexi bacterium]|nr:SAM-dependent chlorinase/fluorinase [Chloroflexota bacterium]
MTTITLLSDFGLQDGYVGVMKGVILGIAPGATLVDLSHLIPPQDVAQGAFALGAAAPFFAPDTVHLAVVDPGVGTNRRAVAVTGPGGTFVAPDNGLLTHALNLRPATSVAAERTGETESRAAPSLLRAGLPPGWRAVHLTNPAFWRPEISRTFQGRDLFAPVAAHLASGVPLEDMGQPTDFLLALELAQPSAQAEGGLVGRVIAVDHFGNLITNLRAEHLSGLTPPCFDIAGRRIGGLSASYAEGAELLAILGSAGFVEIAIRNGSARARLGVGVGDRVIVRRKRDLAVDTDQAVETRQTV